jgi:hypothetical protein
MMLSPRMRSGGWKPRCDGDQLLEGLVEVGRVFV